MPRVLVIAIGNPLRSDDGFGWRAAEAFQHDPGFARTEILTVHQLTPELAESAAHADLVIFVDAALTGAPGTVHSLELSAREECARFSHVLTPQSLMTLAERLYTKRPKAFLVSVSGESFAHGESLSPEVRESLPILVAKLRDLISAES